jgi:prepilin-type N-terminal cleavage/methylation domain-containing protein
MKIRKNQKGFTLIEALIVVIIVAILATLGIARFLGVREATASATCQAHLSSINAAIKMFTLKYPSATLLIPATILTDAGDPKCPNGGTYYIVLAPASGVAAANETDATKEHEAACGYKDHGALSQLKTTKFWGNP